MPELRNPITSLSDFISRFEEATLKTGRTDLFRGHPDAAFTLKPSLFRRQNQRKDEKNIFRELVSLHPSEFDHDKTVFEQLVRMQHFSLPTRLLDVTYNPLVALYFACKSHPAKDGQLLRFSIKSKTIKYYDSDTVSCLSNLSNLTGKERNEIRKLTTSEELRDSSHAGKRLLQFIRAEKSYFLPEIDIDHLNSVIAVRPKNNNRRIIAQQGGFLLFGLPSEITTDGEHGIVTYRFPIAAVHKAGILKTLDNMNINESSLFPEIETAAKYIMSKLVPVADGPEDEV